MNPNPLQLSTAPRDNSLSANFENAEVNWQERCEQFTQVIADLRASEAALLGDIENGEMARRKLLREMAALRNELNRVREEDPKSKQIREVLEYWLEALGKNKRTKTPMDGDRAAKVRKALKQGYGIEQLKQAIDGLAKLPYVGTQGRMETGKRDQRYDDITLCLRDETTIERFMRYAAPDDDPEPLELPVTAPVEVQPRPVQRAPKDTRRPIHRVLDAIPGTVKAAPSGDCWQAQCPAHDDRDPSLSIRVEVGLNGEIVLLNCFGGCDTADVVAALGLGFADLVSTEDAYQPRRESKRVPAHLRQAMEQLLSDKSDERRAA